jgi:hypothetical protein
MVFGADQVLQQCRLKKHRPSWIALGPASCEFQHEHVPPTHTFYLPCEIPSRPWNHNNGYPSMAYI